MNESKLTKEPFVATVMGKGIEPSTEGLFVEVMQSGKSTKAHACIEAMSALSTQVEGTATTPHSLTDVKLSTEKEDEILQRFNNGILIEYTNENRDAPDAMMRFLHEKESILDFFNRSHILADRVLIYEPLNMWRPSETIDFVVEKLNGDKNYFITLSNYFNNSPIHTFSVHGAVEDIIEHHFNEIEKYNPKTRSGHMVQQIIMYDNNKPISFSELIK